MKQPIHPLAFLPVSSGFLVLILALSLALLKINQTTGSPVQVEARAPQADSATLSLSPANQTNLFNPDAYYPVAILIGAGEKNISGADVIIRFDPTKAWVDPKVSSAPLFEQYPVLNVDNEKGLIRLEALNFRPRPADGVLATFRYRMKSIGRVQFSFEFANGSKTDSNIVSSNQDILTNVDGASYWAND